MGPASDPRRRLGRSGEEIVARYLAGHGYTVLCRNYRCPLGEIDIVAQEGDCLVLLEVRTRRGRGHGTPEESITPAKRERLRRLAEAYVQAQEHPPVAYRVDVAAVELSPRGRLLRVSLIRDALL